MCNVTIAKEKLYYLTLRTEKDLYALRYESVDFLPLTENTFKKVKSVCGENNLTCPLYVYGGDIKFKQSDKNIFNILDILANDYGIYLDYTKITH